MQGDIIIGIFKPASVEADLNPQTHAIFDCHHNSRIATGHICCAVQHKSFKGDESLTMPAIVTAATMHLSDLIFKKNQHCKHTKYLFYIENKCFTLW